MNLPAEKPSHNPWLDPSRQGALLIVLGLFAAVQVGMELRRRGGEPRHWNDGTITFQVDVNAADWPELAQLPGLGETLARRIVASRQTSGPFRSYADLDRVKGIGPRTIERIRPFLAPLPHDEQMAGD